MLISEILSSLAMFVIGYQLGSMKVRTLLGEWQVYVVIFFKLVVIPVLALVFVKILAEEFFLMEKVIVLCFAMPAASASVLFSIQYHGETDFATKVVLLSTLCSLAVIPLFAIIIEL